MSDFKRLLEEAAKQNVEKHLDQEVPPLPENTFEEIMKKVKAQEEQEPIRKPAKLRRRLVAAVVVAALLALIGAGAYAVKIYVYDLNVRETASGVQITYGLESTKLELTEEEAYKLAEVALGRPVPFPHWLPDDVTFETANLYKDLRTTFLYSGQNSIEYTVYLKLEQNSQYLDSRNWEKETILIEGKEINLFRTGREDSDELWYVALWSEDVLTFRIETNIMKEDLIRFIENLEVNAE